MQEYKLVVEKHADGFVAYPVGIEGIVVGEGDTHEATLADLESAVTFHLETFACSNSNATALDGRKFDV